MRKRGRGRRDQNKTNNRRRRQGRDEREEEERKERQHLFVFRESSHPRLSSTTLRETARCETVKRFAERRDANVGERERRASKTETRNRRRRDAEQEKTRGGKRRQSKEERRQKEKTKAIDSRHLLATTQCEVVWMEQVK
jgi:hypothetical protein